MLRTEFNTRSARNRKTVAFPATEGCLLVRIIRRGNVHYFGASATSSSADEVMNILPVQLVLQVADASTADQTVRLTLWNYAAMCVDAAAYDAFRPGRALLLENFIVKLNGQTGEFEISVSNKNPYSRFQTFPPVFPASSLLLPPQVVLPSGSRCAASLRFASGLQLFHAPDECMVSTRMRVVFVPEGGVAVRGTVRSGKYFSRWVLLNDDSFPYVFPAELRSFDEVSLSVLQQGLAQGDVVELRDVAVKSFFTKSTGSRVVWLQGTTMYSHFSRMEPTPELSPDAPVWDKDVYVVDRVFPPVSVDAVEDLLRMESIPVIDLSEIPERTAALTPFEDMLVLVRARVFRISANANRVHITGVNEQNPLQPAQSLLCEMDPASIQSRGSEQNVFVFLAESPAASSAAAAGDMADEAVESALLVPRILGQSGVDRMSSEAIVTLGVWLSRRLPHPRITHLFTSTSAEVLKQSKSLTLQAF